MQIWRYMGVVEARWPICTRAPGRRRRVSGVARTHSRTQHNNTGGGGCCMLCVALARHGARTGAVAAPQRWRSCSPVAPPEHRWCRSPTTPLPLTLSALMYYAVIISVSTGVMMNLLALKEV